MSQRPPKRPFLISSRQGENLLNDHHNASHQKQYHQGADSFQHKPELLNQMTAEQKAVRILFSFLCPCVGHPMWRIHLTPLG